MKKKITNFLYERNLLVNLSKSSCFRLKKNKFFNFLGFTFRYFIKSKLSRITEKRNNQAQKLKLKLGLFVYASNNSILILKLKLKKIFKYICNGSVFLLINKLNPVLRS